MHDTFPALLLTISITTGKNKPSSYALTTNIKVDGTPLAVRASTKIFVTV